MRRERLVVHRLYNKMDGKERGEDQERIRKNCDDAFNVNNFRLRFYVFNYRVAASLWQRDETTAKLDEAGLRSNPHSRHFLRSSHYQDRVCVVPARACIRVRAFAYSPFVTSSTLHLADLTIYIPPPLPAPCLERKSPPLFSGTLKSRHFSPWKNAPFGVSFFFFFFFAQKYLFHWRNGVVSKKGRPLSNRPLSSIVSILLLLRILRDIRERNFFRMNWDPILERISKDDR